MSNLFSLLSVARDALGAQSAALELTGRNVANASTPGYSRRVARLETQGPGGGAGGGVRFAGEDRAADRLIERRLSGELGRQGAASARRDALRDVESTLAAGGSFPVAQGLNDLATAWSKLAQSPTDVTARSAVLSSAAGLASRVAEASTALRQASNDVVARAGEVAGDVNERLASIASLNAKIAAATGAGEAAGDLRDRRDALAREVAERTGATPVEDASGGLALLAGGVALVEGDRAVTLEAGVDAGGALVVSARRPGGATSALKGELLGGSLGGLRQAHASDLAPMRASLDRLAGDLAGAFNAEHAAGVGLDGQGGRPLFAFDASAPDPAATLRLDPSVDGRPEAIAAARAPGASGDGSVALRLAEVAYRAPAGGGASPSDRVANFAGALGTAIAAADAEASLRADTAAQASAARESLVGVSVEEEMVAMTRFQRAFEATTRVLRTTDELLADFLRGL
jgi:flagellar hook-associated protein 1 FlgK